MSDSPRWPVKICDCEAEIVMATSVKTGSLMPFNSVPNKNGQWVLEASADGSPRARFLRAQYRFGVPNLYEPHWGKCPNAVKHRRQQPRSRS